MTPAKRLALLLAFLLCLAAGWGGRAVLGQVALRHLLLPALHRQLPGLQIQFQGVETNLTSRLQVKELTIDYCRDGHCLKLSAPSLTLAMTKLLPWRGREALLRHLTIDLQGAALTGDFGPGAAAASGFSSSADRPFLPALTAIPALPAIQFTGCSLELTGYGTQISGQGLQLQAPAFDPHDPKPYEVKLTAANLRVSGGAWPPQQGSLATTLLLTPGELKIPALFFQGALLLDEAWLTTNQQGLSFALQLHLLQSQGQVRGGIKDGALTLAFHLAQGELTDLATVAGSATEVSGQLQSDGELTMRLAAPESLSGHVSATVVDGSWNGIPLDRLEVTARAADQLLTIDHLKLLIDHNQLTVEKAVLPIPELKQQAWLPLLAASCATAQLSLVSPETLPPVWTAPFLADWQALGLTSASASLNLRDSQLLLSQADLAGKAGRAVLTAGELSLSGPLTDWLEVPWSVDLQLELTDAAVVRHFYEDWPATGGTAHAQGRFTGSLNQPHLPFTATFQNASLYGIPLAKVAGQVEWTKDRLALEVTAHNRDRDQLTWQGTIDIDQGALLKTRVSTSLVDLHPYLPKSWLGDTSLSGSLTGSATLDGPFSNLHGQVTATGDWSVQGVKLSGAELAAGLSGRHWAVKRLTALIDDGVLVNAAGRLSPSADWQRVAVDFDALALAYHDQELRLTAPGGLTVAANSVTVLSPLSLVGQAGRFRLEGNPGQAAALTLIGEDLRDTGLLRQLSGKEVGFTTLGFALDLSGAWPHPDWRWQGRVQGLTVAGSALAMDGDCDLASDGQGLRFRHCTVASSEQSIKLVGLLPLAVSQRQWVLLSSPIDFQAQIDLPAGGLLPQLWPEWLVGSGAVHADLDLKGTWEAPLGHVQLNAQGLIPGPRLAVLPPGPFAAQGALQVEKDHVAVTSFDLSSPGLTLQLAGVVNQFPLAALRDVGQQPLPGQLEIKGRYALPALDWLATKVGGLRRTTGSADGAFALHGPLSHPEVRATLALKNGAARGSDSLLVLRDLALNATLDHEQVTIDTLTGTMGGSPVQGAGTIKNVWAPAPQLDLALTGHDLLLYRADGMKIRADTNLALTGTSQAPKLAGEFRLTDSRISRRVNWLSFLKPGASHNHDASFHLFSLTAAPWNDTHLDLRIKTAQPMLISNNVFKGEVRPDLVLAGTGEVPYLTGVIYTDSGRITLPSGRLDLENGLVRFTDEAPDRPQLEFQANGQMMAYDITAQVRGPFDEPEITLSSVPPLASEDLLLLLLTGRRPVEAGQSNNDVSTVAVYLGRGLLARLFGDQADQLLLLDRLEVDIGRAVTQQGEPTVDARVKLAADVWKADTSFYLTGEKDIWDYYNGGVRAVFRFR